MFKILSPSESAKNLQQNYGNISHHTLNVFLHYLAKSKRWCIIIFDHSGHKHLASKSNILLT